MASSPRIDPTVAQLTGNFCLAMDIWGDIPMLSSQSIHENSLMIDPWLGVTDEEMNKFWDTLPKEHGGLM